MPFFKAFKKVDKFKQSAECQEAFEQFKEHLKSLPTLTSSIIGETLFLYLIVAKEAMKTVLIKEDSGVQLLIYYVSHALNGPENRYTSAEKLARCLIHIAHRLKPYFLAHPICIRTNHHLHQILTKLEESRRLTKWAVELSEYDLSYEP